MRKWIIAIIILVAIFFTCVYVFIPRTIAISESKVVPGNMNAAYRFLSSEDAWKKWWPGNSANPSKSSNTTFSFHDYTFNLTNNFFNGITFQVNSKNISAPASITIIPLEKNSIGFQFQTTVNTGSNPFTKLSKSIEVRKLKSAVSELLAQYSLFLNKEEQVYGMNVKLEMVKDTILISTKTITENYPSATQVYSLVDKLRAYIKGKGVNETNPPMLNVNKQATGYEVMVAIPIDKVVPGDETFAPKRMVPGKILVAEVKGGQGTIENSWNEMENYVQDHRKVSPAIPFQSLITDRLKEPDTNKWVTRIYYPIF